MRIPSVERAIFTVVFVALLAMGWACLRLPDQPFLGMSLRGTDVSQVRAGSPAERAGLRAGDRLEKIDGIDVRVLPSSFSFLRSREQRPSRLFLDRRGHPIWAELVPRPLPAREKAWSLGLSGIGAILLLLGAFTFTRQAGGGSAAWAGLCVLLGLFLSPFGQDASSGGIRGLGTSFPGDRTGLLVFVFLIVVVGGAFLPQERPSQSDLERLAHRWLVYLGLGGLFVLTYFAGYFALERLIPIDSMAETIWGVGLAFALFALIISPLCERVVNSLNRHSV